RSRSGRSANIMLILAASLGIPNLAGAVLSEPLVSARNRAGHKRTGTVPSQRDQDPQPATGQTIEASAAAERPFDRRALALSLGLHAAVIAALIGFWHNAPPHALVLPRVTVLFEPGSAGAKGGGQGAERAAGSPESQGQSQSSPSPATADNEIHAASAPTEDVPAQIAPAPMPNPATSPAQAAPATPPTNQPPSPPNPAAELPALSAASSIAPTRVAAAPPKPEKVAAAKPPAPHPRHKPAPPQPAGLPPRPLLAQAPPPTTASTERHEPQAVAVLPSPSAAPSQAAAASAESDAPQASTAGSGVPGPGQGLAGHGSGSGVFGSNPGPGDDWLDAARRRLLRFMKNPNEGREHPNYGTAWVRITVARDGRVLAAAIDRSSGVGYLDRSALQMVHDASPLPPLPADVRAAQVTFSIPAKYEPGFFERLFR
ncbi:MAG: energy transducer TonB family protein, partial [Stellaceae bacterium]